jgi:hypothetical protein
MRKFNGVPKAQCGLYLKECEWRFNNSDPLDKLSQSNDELTVTSDSYLGQPQINKLISLAASQIDLSDFRLRGYGLMETFSNQDLF